MNRTGTGKNKCCKKVIFMKKTRLLLFSLVIVVIAFISFQSIATAAQVTRINARKGLIFIDGSIAEGFVMGAQVCFYASTGEQITCGRVEQASQNYARVKVNNQIAKKIQYGMTAKLSNTKDTNEKAAKPLPCTNDSDCGDTGFCYEGNCRQR
jgi:hypothetical protein